MARQAGADWADHLSPVLMGLRASLREDSLTSPADLVFGSPLRLPGAFFEQESPTSSSPDEFVQDLRLRLAAVVPHPVPFHQAKSPSGFLPAALMSARAVFLRVDAVRRPLEPPYEGPFEVLHRTTKTFTIRRGLKDVVVSVDRLKPAFSSDLGQVLPWSPRPFRPPSTVPVSAAVRPSRPSPPSPAPLTSSVRPPSVHTRSGRLSRPAVRFADQF